MDLIIIALASYRAARMIAQEEGPFSLFSKVRYRVDPKQDTWVGRGINCPLCIGIYSSIALWGLYQCLPILVFILAIAGLQTILQRISS